jgi:pyridoxal phosphate enzyme (YggS family)
VTIAQRLAAVRAHIAHACAACNRDPGTVELLAVSKTRTADEVREALEAGQTIFGENRIQELATKADELADVDLRWHLIGSVQTNKVRLLCAVPKLVLVQSIDRSKLVDKLASVLAEIGGSLDVLIQVEATGEESKHGALPEDVPELAQRVTEAAPQLRLCGLMAIGPLRGDPVPVFSRVARLREELRDATGLPLPVLSLGMTGDLDAAIAAGSTLVRVGTGIFGERANTAR